MLTDSLVSLVTEYFRHANVTACLASMSPMPLSLHAKDWWWSEGGLTLLAHDGAPWHLLYYLVGALLLLLIYRFAFMPVDRVRVSTILGVYVSVMCVSEALGGV